MSARAERLPGAGRARPVGLRRRLDTLGLRMQARLDAEWADRVLPWAFAAVLFVVLTAMALAVVRQLDGGPGLGVWGQAAWNVRHGSTPASTLAGADPVVRQWSFVALPVLEATRWIPTPQALAGTQALALALAVVPIWRLAREDVSLRIGTTAAVVMAYALAPTVHAANLSIFHPEALAVPGLAWAALFGRRRRWPAYWLCVALVLLCRADLGVAVAALGALGVLEGFRRHGWITVAVGGVWSAAAVVILDPRLPTGPITAAQAFAAEGAAPLAELRALFTDPLQVLTDLLSQPSLPVLVALFAPLLFLPLTTARYLIPALPPLVLGIAGDQAVQRLVAAGEVRGGLATSQVVVATVPVFIAAVVALGRIGRRSITRVNVDHRLVAALVLASAVLFVQSAPSSPYQQPWAWGSRDDTDRARLAAVDAVPETAAVTVSPQLAALVAERRVVHDTWIGPPERAGSFRPTTPAVILDTTATDANGSELWDPSDRRAVRQVLVRRGYAVVFERAGILALTR